MSAVFGPADLLTLMGYCSMMSLITIGGGMSVIPEFHRFMVTNHGWLDDGQFVAAIALGQTTPGPNVLYVGMLGWSAGFVGGGYGWAIVSLLGALAAMTIPSTLLAGFASGWIQRNREGRLLRSFTQGMAPAVLGLMASTGWLLLKAHDDPSRDWQLWAMMVAAALVLWFTRLHLLWLLAAGALAGSMGLV